MPAKLKLPDSEIEALFKDGASIRQLAGRYGCCVDVIRNSLHQSGVVIGTPRRVWSPSDQAALICMYRAGEPVEVIASFFDRSVASVFVKLSKLQIPRADDYNKGANDLDHHFFDVIDTEEKAYWLGFLLADGSIFRRGGSWRLSVGLQKSDKAHLEKLKRALKFTGDLHTYGKLTHFAASSAQLCKALVQLECYPKKTACHGTPEIPKELYRHMYRGATDGDGHIGVSGSCDWRYELIGSPEFVLDYQRWLHRGVRVGLNKVYPKGLVLSLRYSGGCQTERICRLLYEGATVYLDRKYEMYQRLLVRQTRAGPQRKAA